MRPSLALVLLGSGCASVLGADFDDQQTGGAGGSDSGVAADANTQVCTDGPSLTCYEGPLVTLDVGACHAGTASCVDGGYAACVGQVIPASADCQLDAVDRDCDGKTGERIWNRRLGSSTVDRLATATEDASGNVFLTGFSYGSIDVTPTLTLVSGMYLIKLDAAGKPLWGKSWPSSQGFRVAATPDGGVVLSGVIQADTDFGGGMLSLTYPASPVLVKFDGQGNHVWSKVVGTAAYDILVASNGHLFIGGSVWAPPAWPTPPVVDSLQWSGVVGELDGKGEAIWIHDFGLDLTTSRIARDSVGNLWVASRLWTFVDLGGGSIGEGGLITSYIAKLDPTGHHLWSRSFSSLAEYFGVPAIAVAPDDTVWMATQFGGSFQIEGTTLASVGEHDVAVLHLDATGKMLSAKRFGDERNQMVWSGAVDSEGNFIVGGSFGGSLDAGDCAIDNAGVAGSEDAFLMKFDTKGDPMWFHTFGDASDTQFEGYPDEVFTSISIGADDHITVAGTFDGSVDFGKGALTSGGAPDLVVVRFTP